MPTDSTFNHAIVTVDVPVRFAETDLMGIVHHAAYLVWFEIGRVAWMDAAGMPYTEIAANSRHFAVTGIHVEYRAAARFGDTIRVQTKVAQLRSRQISFIYELYNARDQTLLATGRSDHICVDLEGHMAKVPSHILERLEQGADQLATGERNVE